MIGQAVKCDICGLQKQETNHWLVAITRPGMEGLLFLPAEAAENPHIPGFTYEDICGEACLHKRLSRWLTDLNAPAPTTQESVTV
jgi:hypothetical protein